MRYMGSKNKIAKEIVPLIQSYITEDTEGYLEPFVGGGNVIDKIVCKRRVGADIEPYVIACLSALSRGWEPPKQVSEEEYKSIQRNKEQYPAELVGYVGYQLSYGGKFFGGYRRDKVGRRDYCAEAYRFTQKQIPLLPGIEFVCRDYRSVENLEGWVIYCDPPYKGVTKYSNGIFDYDDFYRWCGRVAEKNVVLVSEREMPENYKCIWRKNIKVCLDVNRETGKESIEKLFIAGR